MSDHKQTGPASPAGKANSSRNATKHGLTCLHPVVTEADRPNLLDKKAAAGLSYTVGAHLRWNPRH